jgi:signal recognition particle subunit SRP54
MVPGLGGMVRQLEDQLPPDFTENQLTKIEAIINSMTTVERERPRIINASRKRRIAKGSGTSVQDVNGLLKQFRQMKRMMKQLKKGKLPSILSGFR